jgi:hypothetical protein
MSGLTFSTDALAATPTTGATEYNGTALYFTPSGTQRGVVPGQQMFVLNTTVTGNNATGAQSVFGLTNGVTLANSTVYAFDFAYALSKTAGTTSHTIGYGFGGTATTNNIAYLRNFQWSSSGFTSSPNTAAGDSVTWGFVQSASSTTLTSEYTSTASMQWMVYGKGTVSINAGGTFLPQYSLSAAPGGAYTTQIGSYFLIYPIGAAGANVSIGTWS